MANIQLRCAIVCLLFIQAALSGCGLNDEKQAFEIFMLSRQALEAGDVAALKSYLAAEKAAEIEGPGAEMALEIARSVMPQDIRLVSGAFTGNEGTLTLTGQNIMDDGDSKLSIPAEGTVLMVKEGGSWKIAKEDWSMQLDLAMPIFDVRPFMKEGQRPVALKVFEGHAGGATEIVHTPNWKFLITSSYDDFSLRVWDVSTGQELANRTLDGRPTSLAVTDDGQTVYIGTVGGDVIRWPLDTFGQLGEPTTIFEDAGRHVSVSPDGKLLASTSHDAPVVVYDMVSLAAPRILEGSEKLRSTTFSPSGDALVGSEGNQLIVWNTGGWGSKSYSLDKVSPDSTNSPISFSADGHYLGIPCGDSSIIVFDMEKRSVKHNFFVSEVAATAIEFSPDGSLFATAQNNQQINVWGIEDHKRVGYILSKKANATALRFSPDGRYLIAGHEDRQIVFWGVAGADEKAVAETPSGSGAGLPQPARAQQPERVAVLSQTNYLNNPNANQHQQFWNTSGDVAVEDCAPGNPCFVTRWNGKFIGTAELPAGSTGKYMLLIGSATSERVHENDEDQAGEAYIHGYGESLTPNVVRGKHYSADTLQTLSLQHNQWATIWGVFEVGDSIDKVSFEIRQSDGHSAKDGSASRFDDLGVYLFDTEGAAQGFVAHYEREVGRVASNLPGTQDSQPPASLAPAAAASQTSTLAKKDSAITKCDINGRIVFTTAAQCAQQRGR